MIQLSKGGNINLAKEANGVTEFSIGLGWDIATQAGVEFDLDVAAIPLNAQDRADDPDEGLIFYNHPNWKDAIKHSGDNRTGAGAGRLLHRRLLGPDAAAGPALARPPAVHAA